MLHVSAKVIDDKVCIRRAENFMKSSFKNSFNLVEKNTGATKRQKNEKNEPELDFC